MYKYVCTHTILHALLQMQTLQRIPDVQSKPGKGEICKRTALTLATLNHQAVIHYGITSE
jgi:hypothetical protein